MGADVGKWLPFAKGDKEETGSRPEGQGSPPTNSGSEKQKPSVFTIKLLDDAGAEIKPAESGCYKPERMEARALLFYIDPTDTEPTEEQMALCKGLADYEHAIREIYVEGPRRDESKFRDRFIALFGLSQLILEGHVTEVPDASGKLQKHTGKTLPVKAAKKEIELLHQDLIDDAAPWVKNDNFKRLRNEAMKLAPFFLVAYVVLRLLPTGLGDTLSNQFSIEPLAASNFMLLWVGVFVGVCLSYAVRTQQFTLADLTRPSADYFSPGNRLLLAGAFATLLALLAIVGLGEVKIGELSLTDVANKPMVALTLGAVLGLFEYKLTGLVAARVAPLFPADTK